MAPATAFTSMHMLNLPLADLSDIQNNFQNVGMATGFTLQQFIAQCIAFTVLFGVTYKFGWKPVRTILEQRQATIEESMRNAEEIKKKLVDAEESRLAVLQKANEQATAAHEASVLERNRLLAELKREVGALVVQTTEKVAGKVLTADDQNRLNSETLRQLGASNN